MTCCYCKKDKELIKAHVIPKAFFRRLGLRDDQILTILTNNDYPKRAPVGIYDCNILCNECERQFGDWDNYAQELLGDQPKNSTPIVNAGMIGCYEISGYKYDYLKLFFISLLWRAAVSKHPFYAKVELGPYEADARKLIEKCEPGSADDFSVTLAKFDPSLNKIILDPQPVKLKDVKFYCFYLGNYVAYVKTDRRKAPNPLLDFIMKPDEPLRIIVRDLQRSKELPLINKIATTPNNSSWLKRKQRVQ